MQEKHLFEYAVVRVVPKVEREEFVNVGVILYCSRKKYVGFEYLLDPVRLHSFSASIDIDEVRKHLQAFKGIASGTALAGPIAKLDPASRFRWLTATRSTILQSSKVHPGFCEDPDITLKRLFDQLVSMPG